MPQAGVRSFFGRAVGGEPGGGEAERNRGGGFRLPQDLAARVISRQRDDWRCGATIFWEFCQWPGDS